MSIVARPPDLWQEEELSRMTITSAAVSSESAASVYNPTPGTGRTGFTNVPPNNYPFYDEDHKYAAVMQTDGGQLSDWKAMYNPTPEQAELDRRKAYEAGIPNGFAEQVTAHEHTATLHLQIVSELHDATEYGERVAEDGSHSGGPFWIDVSPQIRVQDLRKIIRDKGGILPGLQRLAYAGKNLEDPQRTLQHYGVDYWQKTFPEWAIKIRKY